jgi:hypothetical protein
MWANMVTIAYRDSYTREIFALPVYMGEYTRPDELSPAYTLIHILRPLILENLGLKLKFKLMKLKRRGRGTYMVYMVSNSIYHSSLNQHLKIVGKMA